MRGVGSQEDLLSLLTASDPKHTDGDKENTPANKIPCRFHMRGICKNGSNCSFSHAKAESLLKIKVVEGNLSEAWKKAESQIRMEEDPSKNWEQGVQLEKLHSLRYVTYQALNDIKNKVRTGELVL